MQLRRFGNSDLEVTPLGLGTAELGLAAVSQEVADRLLNAALDMGINLVDTAACYGQSEVRIGSAIAGRRAEYILVSKCGHRTEDLQGPPEWSAPIVRASLERSLRRLRTDHLDVLLLHSCSVELLDNHEMIRALQDARQAGKTRLIGYSGDDAAAAKALDMNVLDVLEISVNLADQQAVDEHLPRATAAGLGVLAKRPAANSCWRDLSEMGPFYVGYAKPYAERLHAMSFTPESLGFDGTWMELALRFATFQAGVSAAIVGSRNPDHIRQNVAYIEKGPLPRDIEAKIRQAWHDHAAATWTGLT